MTKMNSEDEKKIEEIMASMECPHGFKCVKSGFERLCEAEDYGLEGYVKCNHGNPAPCAFSLSFGRLYFCRCPLRVFLSRDLKK